jgi:hypothetical protein
VVCALTFEPVSLVKSSKSPLNSLLSYFFGLLLSETGEIHLEKIMNARR